MATLVLALALSSLPRLAAAAPSSAAALIEEGFVVPPLACFGAPTQRLRVDAVRSDFSSLTWNAEDDTLFAVNNGEATAFELKLEDGSVTKLGEWKLPMADPEAISHLGGRTFAVTDENPASLYVLDLPPNGNAKHLDSVQNATNVIVLSKGIDPPAEANLGFEGVAFLRGIGFFVAQEQQPAALWFLPHDGAAFAETNGDPPPDNGSAIVRAVGDTAAALGISALSDVGRGGDAVDEIFVLSKAPRQITRLDVSDPSSVVMKEQFAGAVCGMGQPEGLAFRLHPTTGKVQMLVAGEPTEMLVFEADPACTEELNATVGDMFECPPPPEPEDGGCMRTRAEGGCPRRRCDKSLSNSSKVCTDDSPETQCTLDECEAKCVAHEGFNCSAYAYDIAESECYVFETCEGEKDEPDYTLYVLESPICTNTMEEGGCPRRRCDKSLSNSAKVCTDDSPETQCTLEQCKQKCKDHAPFLCTTYAYDEAESECYVFETCVNEMDEPDYTLYVMTNPFCRKGVADGGCPERECSLDSNEHVQVCDGELGRVDDPSATPCSLEECAQKCETYDGGFRCSHFMHDAADQDCIILASCNGEQFNDDFTVFLA